MSYDGGKNKPQGVPGLDATGKILNSVLPNNIDAQLLGDGSVNNTEFEYLDGVTAPIQTQIDNIIEGIVTFKADAMAIVDVDLSLPGTDVFDSVSVEAGGTVFILGTTFGGGQIDLSQGGLYTFNGPSVAMTRIPTMNTWDEVVGSQIIINNSTGTKALTKWINNNTAGGTLGTTNIEYVVDSGGGATYNLLAGTGVTIITTPTDKTIQIGQPVAPTDTVQFDRVVATTEMVVKSIYTDGGGPQDFDAFIKPVLDLTSDVTMNIPKFDSTAVVSSNPPNTNNDADSQFMQGVSIEGEIYWSTIFNSTLTNLVPTTGPVYTTDTLLEGLNKIVGNQGIPRMGVEVAGNAQLTNVMSVAKVLATDLTVVLPDATTMTPYGAPFTVKLVGGSVYVCNIEPFAGQTVDGATSISLTGLYSSMNYFSDGTNLFTC